MCERRRVAGRQRQVQPAHSLGRPVRDPVVTQRGGDIEAASEVPSTDALMEHCSQVVNFQIGPREPLDEVVSSLVSRTQTRQAIVLDATILKDILLVSLAQFQAGVLTHRLVEPVADGAPDVLGGDQ